MFHILYLFRLLRRIIDRYTNIFWLKFLVLHTISSCLTNLNRYMDVNRTHLDRNLLEIIPSLYGCQCHHLHIDFLIYMNNIFEENSCSNLLFRWNLTYTFIYTSIVLMNIKVLYRYIHCRQLQLTTNHCWYISRSLFKCKPMIKLHSRIVELNLLSFVCYLQDILSKVRTGLHFCISKILE